MICFACISPHPPLLLPSVGGEKERKGVEKTIKALEKLGQKFQTKNPEKIVISSPHRDWGFNVPLHFLAKDFTGEIEKVLIGCESPDFYFEKGRQEMKNVKSELALIASGDLSHRLKEEGPYGFHPQGPKFDQALIRTLKEKDVERMLALDREFPQAGECGLRSFCFLVGALEGLDWQVDILSYEAPFGVGYLVAELKG